MSASLHSVFLVVFPNCQYPMIDANAIQKAEGNFTHMMSMMHKV